VVKRGIPLPPNLSFPLARAPPERIFTHTEAPQGGIFHLMNASQGRVILPTKGRIFHLMKALQGRISLLVKDPQGRIFLCTRAPREIIFTNTTPCHHPSQPTTVIVPLHLLSLLNRIAGRMRTSEGTEIGEMKGFEIPLQITDFLRRGNTGESFPLHEIFIMRGPTGKPQRGILSEGSNFFTMNTPELTNFPMMTVNTQDFTRCVSKILGP
jgi:hypothetical protein